MADEQDGDFMRAILIGRERFGDRERKESGFLALGWNLVLLTQQIIFIGNKEMWCLCK